MLLYSLHQVCPLTLQGKLFLLMEVFNLREEKISVSRDKTMLNKAVIVDGIPGCGKTLVSSIISSFKK